MLYSITPHNTSSESTFVWVKELLARGEHEIFSSDELTGQIETKHAVFLVIEKGADVDYSCLGTAFAEAIKENKNFAILAPDLADTAIGAINGFGYPELAAVCHRKDVLATKVIIATTEMTIKQAVNEMTHVNKALRAFGKIYTLQRKYWFFFPIVAIASILETFVHAPANVHNPTLLVLFTLGGCEFIVWIAGRWRISAAKRRVANVQR